MALSKENFCREVKEACNDARYNGVRVSSYHKINTFEVKGLSYNLVKIVVDHFKTLNHFVDDGDADILADDTNTYTRNGGDIVNVVLAGCGTWRPDGTINDNYCTGIGIMKRIYEEFKNLVDLFSECNEEYMMLTFVKRYKLTFKK